MGGTIGFTIRERDGKEHRMFRWTNPFPFFINNMKFIEQDEQHLKEYLQTWHDMVKAYESGDTTQEPMADVYVPRAGLYPTEYGLIVADYRSKVLLACQGYSTPGILDTFHFENAMKGNATNEDGREEVRRIMGLFEAGRMVRMREMGKSKKIVSIVGCSMEQLAKVDAFVELDMSPWKMVQFGFDEKGFNALKIAIKELGFELNEKEEAGWNKFFEHRYR